ncbi:hypothetical protein [Peteryoungia algae]|uniref:Uncharacterized protein n=1 Tax=Peteryoungia algae TaxID=2919917 RepID=A0ABT0D0N4_9HYPH|nr:hypothetical protein [Rhizobium sp. SSM4.3]MCJ8238962.1 hypothetical protein [Rhizobium sp. SSM4.3]
MGDLLGNIVKDVVEGVLKEILKKSNRSGTTRRRKRQSRSATTGRFVRKTTKRVKAPARKQVSRRRTTAKRSR